MLSVLVKIMQVFVCDDDLEYIRIGRGKEKLRASLSHADIKKTTRYAHVSDEKVAAAMEKLSQKKNRANKA